MRTVTGTGYLAARARIAVLRFADGLATKVPADAEVLIVPAVSGG
jgi:molybdopterin converting factor small subunit